MRGLDDAGLIEAMGDAARLESAVMARRLAAVAELYLRRLAEQDADERARPSRPSIIHPHAPQSPLRRLWRDRRWCSGH